MRYERACLEGSEEVHEIEPSEYNTAELMTQVEFSFQ